MRQYLLQFCLNVLFQYFRTDNCFLSIITAKLSPNLSFNRPGCLFCSVKLDFLKRISIYYHFIFALKRQLLCNCELLINLDRFLITLLVSLLKLIFPGLSWIFFICNSFNLLTPTHKTNIGKLHCLILCCCCPLNPLLNITTHCFSFFCENLLFEACPQRSLYILQAACPGPCQFVILQSNSQESDSCLKTQKIMRFYLGLSIFAIF